MRPEAIFDILCLLLLFSVNSHTSCPSGWFGFQCKYKCRCTNDECDAVGECTGGRTCQGGWFGPACQYADLAYGTVSDAVVVDGNDSTCLAGAKTKVTVKLTDSFPFSWLRDKVTNQGSADLKNLAVTFSDKSRNVACTNPRKQYLDSTTLDIHCELSSCTDNVTLDGNSAGHLCSVYISGGRNVALKENATQDTTYSDMEGGVRVNYTADKAVDGNRDQNLHNLSCSVTGGRNTVQDPNPAWSVTMSKQRSVDRYVIYNRGDAAQYRLVGFKLQVFVSPTQSLYAIQDSNRLPKTNYTISHNALVIQKVAISGNVTEAFLTLCEVEIYGDSVCDDDHYGRDCELKCRCPDGEACVVTTGGCPSVCPPGFDGPSCSKQCDAGTYGADCRYVCSENCKAADITTLSPCDRIDGACLMGCEIGYIKAKCDEKCSVGQFGENCSLHCSPNCVASYDANVSSCDHETGACIMGCKSGWGDSCNISCSSGCAASGESDTSQCNQTTGACIMGCKNGFGEFCNLSCSPGCAASGKSDPSQCNMTTGVCYGGCKGGFTGKNCDNKCGVGKFGDQCNSSCSPSCVPTGDPMISPCSHETGECIKGCKNGYTGENCVAVQSKATPTSGSSSEIIAGLCTTLCLVAFLGYFLCKKRNTGSKGESTAGHSLPVAENTAQ